MEEVMRSLQANIAELGEIVERLEKVGETNPELAEQSLRALTLKLGTVNAKFQGVLDGLA